MRPHTYHSAMDHERASVISISSSIVHPLCRYYDNRPTATLCGRATESKNPLNILLCRVIAAFRLGKIISKVGLVQVLRKYNFEALDNKALEFEPHSVPLVIKGGINLRVTKRVDGT